MLRVPQPHRERRNQTQPAEPAAARTLVGYLDGHEVLFMATEASDPELCEQLTQMIGSPVIGVPELAEIPDEALGRVYVFANGTAPDGAPAGSDGRSGRRPRQRTGRLAL